ncbi:MAG: hypothetical protein IKE69_10065 [Thermoguttaceae bacterium]|nr:hypothetical protein [Thermoguttaceae bacterium]
MADLSVLFRFFDLVKEHVVVLDGISAFFDAVRFPGIFDGKINIKVFHGFSFRQIDFAYLLFRDRRLLRSADIEPDQRAFYPRKFIPFVKNDIVVIVKVGRFAVFFLKTGDAFLDLGKIVGCPNKLLFFDVIDRGAVIISDLLLRPRFRRVLNLLCGEKSKTASETDESGGNESECRGVLNFHGHFSKDYSETKWNPPPGAVSNPAECPTAGAEAFDGHPVSAGPWSRQRWRKRAKPPTTPPFNVILRPAERDVKVSQTKKGRAARKYSIPGLGENGRNFKPRTAVLRFRVIFSRRLVFPVTF